MKLVEFIRHQTPFAAGERAAVEPALAGRYEVAKVGRIVGTVDDKGRILLDDLVGGSGEAHVHVQTTDGAATGEVPERVTGAMKSARSGRQG